jgi:membrane protein implicated in regulation of membrane protease activity
MNQSSILQVSPEIPQMPRELSWAIIVLLACILAWIITRYTTRIDKMLERLDDAIDAIKGTLISHASDIKSNTERINKLESKEGRRRP